MTMPDRLEKCVPKEGRAHQQVDDRPALMQLARGVARVQTPGMGGAVDSPIDQAR